MHFPFILQSVVTIKYIHESGIHISNGVKETLLSEHHEKLMEKPQYAGDPKLIDSLYTPNI